MSGASTKAEWDCRLHWSRSKNLTQNKSKLLWKCWNHRGQQHKALQIRLSLETRFNTHESPVQRSKEEGHRNFLRGLTQGSMPQIRFWMKWVSWIGFISGSARNLNNTTNGKAIMCILRKFLGLKKT